MPDTPLPLLKIVLLGDLGVGKTCLRSQFIHHVFSNAYKATIGADYLTTAVSVGPGSPKKSFPLDTNPSYSADSLSSVSLDPSRANLQVWDTAGQERFNLISQAFYRGADVAVLVYDITNYESLLSVRAWFSRFMEHCHVQSPGVVLVGNKLDKLSERAIDKHEVRAILGRSTVGNAPAVRLDSHIADWDVDFVEISCKELAQVEAVFERAAALGLARLAANHTDTLLAFDNVLLDDAPAVLRCAC